MGLHYFGYLFMHINAVMSGSDGDLFHLTPLGGSLRGSHKC